MPAVIDRLLRRHPQIAVRVVQLNTIKVEFRELEERNVDLVVTRVPRAFVDKNLDIDALFDDSLRVIAGAQSPWARRRSVTLSELVNEAWILPPTPLVDAFMKEIFESHGLHVPSERVTASSIQFRIQMLATGRFLSVLADSVLRENAMRWSLKALPVDMRANLPPWSIVRLKYRTISPVVQLFIEELRAVAKSMAVPPERRKS